MKEEMSLEKIEDTIRYVPEWRIDRFKDPTGEITRQLQNGLSMQEAIRRFQDKYLGGETWLGNVGLNEGLQELIDLICGIGSPTKWDNTNAYLGVGDDNTSPVATQDGLQAATNKEYNAMDGTYPQKSGQVAEWRATFGDGEAEFDWEEYSVSNTNSDSGKNLNRCTASKGTKSSGESWTLSLKITFS